MNDTAETDRDADARRSSVHLIRDNGSYWRSAAVFVLALLVLRVLLVLAALEPAEERVVEIFDPTLLEWQYGPERPLFDREELYTGTAAEAMRQGLPIDAKTFQFMTYGGGSLLTALAARVVYTLFGPSYLAFKILPLLVTLAGGLFWFAAIHRVFGRRIGYAFAVLYAVAPSTFVRTTLIAKGDHPEAMAWIGVVLWMATYAADRAGRRNLWAFFAGLLAGLGVFITYSTVPVLAGVFGVGLLLSRARPIRTWSNGLAGLAVGLVPWLAALVSSRGSALQVYGETVGTTGSAIGARITGLLETGFFAQYDLVGALPLRPLAGFVFLVAVVVGWFFWIREGIGRKQDGPVPASPSTSDTPPVAPSTDTRRGTSSSAWLALGGTAAHLGAFVLAAPDAASRYLMPVYPLLLLAVASLVGLRKGVRVLPGLTAVFGACALVLVLGQSAWTAVRLPLKGTDWPLLGEVTGQKLTPEKIRALPDDVERHFWVGFGKKVYGLVERSEWQKGVELAPENHRDAVWEGVGISIVEQGDAFNQGQYIASMAPGPQASIVRGIARYAEVAFAPVAAHRMDIDLARAEFQMAGSTQQALTESRARSVATLAVQGAGVSPSAWSEIPAPLARRAVGIASFAGVRNGGVRTYPIRTPNLRNIPEGDRDYWAGLGVALGRELTLTTLDAAERAKAVETISTSAPEGARAAFQDAAKSAISSEAALGR
ncbi:MAG: glycosyltransferase family 39 protein [Candidatus Eisenbacteria bacterium]